MNKWLSLPVLACALAGGIRAEQAITIAASPSRFDLRLDGKPVHEALRVFNFGTSRARIEVSVRNWTLDEHNKVVILPPDEQSLDQWMIVSPAKFELPPGETQTVRFSVRPRVVPTPGEHRAIVYLKQEPPPTDDPDRIRVVGRLGVSVYGYVGEIERDGHLHGIDVRLAEGQPQAAFDIASHGTAHVRLGGTYALWSREDWAEGAPAPRPATDHSIPVPEGAIAAGYLPSFPVLPATRRRIGLGLPPGLAPGAYVLDVYGELSGDPFTRRIEFEVAEPPGGMRVAK